VFSAAGVANDNGTPLAADHLLEFFVLAGDVNLDRSVNGSDFALLASNFGKTGQAFAAGDVNGDGSANGSDFAILGQRTGANRDRRTIHQDGRSPISAGRRHKRDSRARKDVGALGLGWRQKPGNGSARGDMIKALQRTPPSPDAL
jgi:hypothetical protein